MKFTILSLLGTTLAQQPHIKIPNDGDFFFMTGTEGSRSSGTSMFEVRLGKQADGTPQVIKNIGLSTQIGDFQVESTLCSTCYHHGNDYYMKKSMTGYEAIYPTAKGQKHWKEGYNSQNMVRAGVPLMEMYGVQKNFMFEDLELYLHQFDREVILKGFGMSSIRRINNPNVNYPLLYTGLIGILPYQTARYSDNSNSQYFSFLQQLQKENMITHQVVSISAKEDRTGEGIYNTVVQFGGYDAKLFQGFNNGEPMVFITTKDKMNMPNWGLLSSKWKIHGINLDADTTDRHVMFDPSLPYMYVSREDFQLLGYTLRVANFPTGDIPYTDNSGGAIYWQKNCDLVSRNMPPLDMSFNVYDSESKYDESRQYKINIMYERMRIDGHHFGNPDRCYLPVFRHMMENLDQAHRYTWYVGSHITAHETLIFDNNPTEGGTDSRHNYAQIGIGPAPRYEQESLLDTYTSVNNIDITNDQDSSVYGEDDFETSLFKGDLFNIAPPSADRVQLDRSIIEERILNETSYIKLQEEIDAQKAEQEQFKREDLEEKLRLEEEAKAKMIHDKEEDMLIQTELLNLEKTFNETGYKQLQTQIYAQKAEKNKFKLEELVEKHRLETEAKAKMIRDKQEDDALFINDEVDVQAPEYDEDHLPSPGLNLQYIYYLWTQISTLTGFFGTFQGMVMKWVHKVIG